MYAAGLKLGLAPSDLARMSYPSLANLLDSTLPREEGAAEEPASREADQSDIDAL